MAFDLKRVLKVMLFASNGPLSVKDIQTAISRFHEQATTLPLGGQGAGSPEQGDNPEAPPAPPEPEEPVLPAAVEDDEFYPDVPTLVTPAQIREAIDVISLQFHAPPTDTTLCRRP